MRNDQVLKLLQERGDQGISAEEIAKKFGYALVGSVCKPINQLRTAGYHK
jgi:biotin operon repressor